MLINIFKKQNKTSKTHMDEPSLLIVSFASGSGGSILSNFFSFRVCRGFFPSFDKCLWGDARSTCVCMFDSSPFSS